MRAWAKKVGTKVTDETSYQAKILAVDPKIEVNFATAKGAISKAKADRKPRFVRNPENWGPRPKHGRPLLPHEADAAAAEKAATGTRAEAAAAGQGAAAGPAADAAAGTSADAAAAEQAAGAADAATAAAAGDEGAAEGAGAAAAGNEGAAEESDPAELKEAQGRCKKRRVAS